MQFVVVWAYKSFTYTSRYFQAIVNTRVAKISLAINCNVRYLKANLI